MKVLAVGGFIVAAGAAVYFFGGGNRPVDVYDMPVQAAYEKLMHPQFPAFSEGEVALNTKRKVSGNGSNVVTWSTVGDMARFECEMGLAPWADDPTETKVTVTCDGGAAGAGAAAGMLHNMRRRGTIEMLDATLRDRIYDGKHATGVAARWPGDGVDGSLGTAVGEAMKMDADMRKLGHEMDKDNAAHERKAKFGSEGRVRSYSSPGFQ
jgi:hypothetical protein